METNLQYIDKRLEYHVISKDDSLLRCYTCLYTFDHMHVHCKCKHTYKTCTQAHIAHADTHTYPHPLWILQRQQGKYLCFESITSHIFIFLSPCCYNFLPCQTNQNTKTKRRLRQQLRFSTVRFTGTLLLQTSSVQRDLTCVFVHLCTVTVHVCMCGWVRWSCVDFQFSENATASSV